MVFESYHFHIYFEFNEIKKAESMVEKLRDNKNIEIGRIWDKPVGPHPIGSCQILVKPVDFQDMTHWFMKNRDELSIFVHGVSGDDWKDHTDHVMWIGQSHKLNLDFFKE